MPSLVGSEMCIRDSDEHCEIVLPFQSVSGEHALLQFKEGAYVLEDLGSTNGIKINGLTPMGAASLYDGDEIALGDARLRFAEEPSPGLIPEPTEAGEEEAAPSAAMRNLQQLADEATRTARKNYLWMALYAVLMFFLAVFAGLTYKHYKVTGELLPLQSVSYTHLTLPTIYSVQISAVAALLKKKTSLISNLDH